MRTSGGSAPGLPRDPAIVSPGLRIEAAGRAALATGELGAADAAFSALEVEAAAAGDGATAGRALALRGRVAHRRGQLGVAGDRYREAAHRLREAGERHAAATAEAQHAAVLVQRGRGSEALAALAPAIRVLAELGGSADADRCGAEQVRAAALLLVGQLDAAREAADAALASAAGVPALESGALVAAGDVLRRLGDEPAAIARYRHALVVATAAGDRQARLAAEIALAEAGQRAGDEPAGAGDDEPDPPGRARSRADDRDRSILARGRLALRDPSSVAGPGSAGALAEATAALARACGEVAARAADADRLERAFRGHAIAAQLALRAGDSELAHREASRAQLAHAQLAAVNAPAFRAALDGDPDLARLPSRDALDAARQLDELRRRCQAAEAASDQLRRELAERAASPPAAPADLRIKPALAAIERSYVASAMARTGGNQSAAARLLGLSRFGLQKKLRRLASDGDAGDD